MDAFERCTTKYIMIALYFYCSILFFSILYSPFLAIILIILSLLFLNVRDSNTQFGITLILLILVIFLNAFDSISFGNFLIINDDFSVYYNNYLHFVQDGLKADRIFEFGYLEIGLPTLNYILSEIIGANEPYKLKLYYAIIQLSLLFISCFFIARKGNFSARGFTLLCCLCFIFYKPLLGIQISRQSLSSFMIVLGIFSRHSISKILFFLLAVIFHSSAIFLYPLASYLFKVRRRKDFIVASIIILLGWLLLNALYGVLALNIINLPVLDKLDFVLRALQDPEMVKLSILTSALLIAYIFPLILYSFVVPKYKYKYNVLIFLVALITYSTYASFNNRVFVIQLYIFLGYYYYYIYESNRIGSGIKNAIVIFCFLFLFIQGHVFINDKARRLPVFGEQPFYYLDGLYEKQNYVDRFKLSESL